MTERDLTELIAIASAVDNIADEMAALGYYKNARVIALHRLVLRLRRVIAQQPETGNNP